MSEENTDFTDDVVKRLKRLRDRHQEKYDKVHGQIEECKDDPVKMWFYTPDLHDLLASARMLNVLDEILNTFDVLAAIQGADPSEVLRTVIAQKKHRALVDLTNYRFGNASTGDELTDKMKREIEIHALGELYQLCEACEVTLGVEERI